MNTKAGEALIHSIFRRESSFAGPAAAATAVVTIAAVPKVRYTADSISASQRNQTAAAYTATLTIRDASIAGTILAQWEFVTAVNAADRFSHEKMGIPGLLNSALVAVWDPPAASVVQKVTLTGYRESFS